MIQQLQNLVLAAGGVSQNGPFFLTCLPGNLINAGHTPGGTVSDVMLLPVLIRAGGAFEKQPVENEIAHTPLVLPRTWRISVGFVGGEKGLDGFIGEAFQDDAGGPDAEGGFDLALAFDVANVEAFAAPLGGDATAVEILGNTGEADAGDFLPRHIQNDGLLGLVGHQFADGLAGLVVGAGGGRPNRRGRCQ